MVKNNSDCSQVEEDINRETMAPRRKFLVRNS